RRLRIWSAGCCTGEEAYSIAIAVTRAVPKWREWQISILGTDLNPRFLHKAAEGIYSQWSFRGLPAEIQRDYFHQTDNGRRFAIAPWIKTLVTFACLNFVEDVYPSLGNSTNAMDVIFCRNVVMYFAREQARRVVGNLHRALVNGGWLFASATEASPELFADFTPANFPGTVVYRKNLPPPRLDLPAPAVPLEVSHTLVSSTSSSAASSSELLAPSLPEAAAPAPSAKARTLANEGRLGEALAACDQAIALHKLDAASHYLRGMILQEQGALDEAAASLKRALFLDQDFVVAHFALGNLMQGRGRATDAKRSFENARALLRRYPAEAVLPESDGISAGRLLAILDATREANR
ncbi:MAG: tetratricopeptide repeat protein, partial [Verrucomicrobia bacterium]|nr:tetratricopeptide repeat protein [Verrucomicrobiota bacterium]